MTKSPIGKKSTPQVRHLAPVVPLPDPDDGVLDADAMFLRHVCKTAKLTAKDLQYCMRVNKTTAYAWYNGEKPSFLVRTREFIEAIRQQNALWVIPSVLEYLAGSDFDGAVLTNEEHAALMVLIRRGEKEKK